MRASVELTVGQKLIISSEGAMDKEDKLGTFDSDTSLDPDAAELLKDLDDDDEEEEYSEEELSGVSSPSLARVISVSSDSLVGLQTVGYVPLNSEASGESDDTSEGMSAKSEAEGSEDVDESAPEKSAEGGSFKSIETIPAINSGVSTKSSIKPFKSSGEKEKHSHEKPSITVKTIDKPETVVKVEGSEPKEEPKEEPKKSLGESGQRSAVTPPPPPPSASMMTKSRILREGEQAYTEDQLKEMLAGGKNDDAPDLAALKTGDNRWYAEIFNEDYLRTIPKSEPRQTRREANFIVDRLGLEPGARVLDLACGTGRHTIQLAKKGYDMVGLDFSMVMLKRALANAQAEKQVIKFIHGDMQKLSFKAIFDAVYCVQTSFGYFDDYRNFKVLQGIFRALKPGGVFLIEVTNRDFIVDDLPLRLWWKGKDCKLLEEIDLEYLTGILKVKRSFVFDDPSRAPWEQNINIRLYTANELRALLMRAGFSVVELSGDYSHPGAFFGATSPRIIYIAEKPIK